MTLFSVFVTDVQQWGKDMGTLPRGIQLWATLFPLPQMILGFWSTTVIGPTSVGAWYFYTRLQSGIVAGQVHKKRPFHKLMGPLMHLPFLVVVPYSILWLMEQNNNKSNNNGTSSSSTMTTSNTAKFHYGFVLYTTCTTAVSLVADIATLIKWMMGYDVGVYKRDTEKKE